MAGALGEVLPTASLVKMICKISMRDGALIRFGRGVAKRQSAAFLGDSLSKIANVLIKEGKRTEHFSSVDGIVLENIKTGFEFQFRFTVAVQLAQRGSAVEASSCNV